MANSATVAVVGCGYWGKNLVRNFSQLGALRIVCDPTEAGKAKAAELVPDATVVGSIDEVLKSDVKGVVFATPAETHYELAKQALESGKDVFVEKPLALSADHGSELLCIAKEKKRIVMVGHVLEYHPGILKMRELIESGQLGKVRYIYSNRLSFGKIRQEENILWSFAPHDIAIILRMVGAIPFQVCACGGTYLQPNIADVTLTSLLFDNGVRAHIHVSWLHPYKEQKLVVIGSEKMASYDDVRKALVLYDNYVEMRDGQHVPVKNDGQTIEFPNDEPLRCECDAFLKSIETRTPPISDGDSGLRVLKVLQAAQRSLVTNGEPVSFPIEAIQS